MPANGKSTARLGLRRMWCIVRLCFFIVLLSASFSAASAVMAQTPESEAASADIVAPPRPESSDIASGDISAPGTASEDIGKSEAQWGTLSVSLSPEGARTAGARWSADGGATWKTSGEILLLSAGDATIVFNSLVGWRTPETIPVKISGESGANAAGTYVQLTGSIRTMIDGPEDARWSVDGRGELPGGSLREGLVPADYTVSFSDVEGWLKPENAVIAVAAGRVETLSVAYVRSGSLSVTIEGPAEARWFFEGGKPLESGALVDNLAPGEYAVSFLGVEKWGTPADLLVKVTPGETALAGAAYVAKSTGVKKEPQKVKNETPTAEAINTGEMRLSTEETQKTAAAAHDGKDTNEQETPESTPDPVDPEIPPVAEKDDVDDPVVVDDTGEKDAKEDDEADEVVDTNDEVIARPRPTPETPVVDNGDTGTVPPPVVRPTAVLPELTDAEKTEIARSITVKRRYLDLGDATYAYISAFVPQPETSLQQREIPEDKRDAFSDALAALIDRDAEGNGADPFLLQTTHFEIDAGDTDTTGKFLVVRIAFTVLHSELAAADPKITGRIESAVASGRPLGDALLDELRIFKWIGEGENARCFDLVERVRAQGFSLNSFFEAKSATKSADEFFDTKAQDDSYTVTFHLLVFDGSTGALSRLVQPLEGGRFIVFDGQKDGKFSDPLIIAAPRPKNAQKQESGGCSVSAGGIGALLLLLPAIFLSSRHRR